MKERGIIHTVILNMGQSEHLSQVSARLCNRAVGRGASDASEGLLQKHLARRIVPGSHLDTKVSAQVGDRLSQHMGVFVLLLCCCPFQTGEVMQ